MRLAICMIRCLVRYLNLVVELYELAGSTANWRNASMRRHDTSSICSHDTRSRSSCGRTADSTVN